MIHCINCILPRTGKRVKWNTSMKCNKVEQQKISLVTLLCWRFVKTEKPRSEKCVVTLCSLLCNIIDCSNKWTECVYLLNNEMKWRRKIVKYFFCLVYLDLLLLPSVYENAEKMLWKLNSDTICTRDHESSLFQLCHTYHRTSSSSPFSSPTNLSCIFFLVTSHSLSATTKKCYKSETIFPAFSNI